MEIDMSDSEKKKPTTEKSRYTDQAKILREHRNYLETVYKRQIGLPLDKKQDISIYSYTEHRIAREWIMSLQKIKRYGKRFPKV